VLLQGTECHGQKLLVKFPDHPIQAFNGTGSPFRTYAFTWFCGTALEKF